SPVDGAFAIDMGDEFLAETKFRVGRDAFWTKLDVIVAERDPPASSGSAKKSNHSITVDRVLTRALVGPMRLLSEALSSFRHVGPLRSAPERQWEPKDSLEPSEWS